MCLCLAIHLVLVLFERLNTILNHFTFGSKFIKFFCSLFNIITLVIDKHTAYILPTDLVSSRCLCLILRFGWVEIFNYLNKLKYDRFKISRKYYFDSY